MTDSFEVREASRTKGRGVFARRRFNTGAEIAVAPLLLVPFEQVVDNILAHYCFEYDNEHHALILGFASLINHSPEPNAEVVFEADTLLARLYATRPIRAGDEITFDYNTELWFEPE
jgi:uncharacterized protein